MLIISLNFPSNICKVDTFITPTFQVKKTRSVCIEITCASSSNYKKVEMSQMSAAAAAAKSLQSCPSLYDPIDGNPPGFPVPGILQARTLEWVAISFSNAWKWNVKVKSLSCAWLLATPWTGAYQAPENPWDFPGKSTGVRCHCLLQNSPENSAKKLQA